MTLVRLVFYGVGTILGAGIFVVIGEVIGEAGALSPIAYLLAGVVALTTALAFAEISARIPSTAGPVDYVEKATGQRLLGTAIGWMLITANTVSAATITTGFVDYLSIFVTWPDWIEASAVILVLATVAVMGIRQSTTFMVVTTSIGLATLLVVLLACRDGLLAAPRQIADDFSSLESLAVTGLFSGAFLAIYSFIGFGDMALTAEEVIDVRRNMPRAIMIVLSIVLVLYVLVSAAVVGASPPGIIADAKAPLAEVVARQGWPPWLVGIGSLFVIVNGALTQIIGAARLLFDNGRDGRGAPAIFAKVDSRKGTPVPATIAISTVVLVLAIAVPLKTLAEATSLVILVVFAAVNIALIILKRREQPAEVPNVWLVVPVLGAITCSGALAAQLWSM